VNIEGRVLGIDGAYGGWAVATCKDSKAFVQFFKKIEDVWYFYRDKLELVLIDIPIGLPYSGKRCRSCDEEARKLKTF